MDSYAFFDKATYLFFALSKTWPKMIKSLGFIPSFKEAKATNETICSLINQSFAVFRQKSAVYNILRFRDIHALKK
jgi:hypothetical protein